MLLQSHLGCKRSDTDRIVVKSYLYPLLFFEYGLDIRWIRMNMDWISVDIYINIFIIYIKLYSIYLLLGYG